MSFLNEWKQIGGSGCVFMYILHKTPHPTQPNLLNHVKIGAYLLLRQSYISDNINGNFVMLHLRRSMDICEWFNAMNGVHCQNTLFTILQTTQHLPRPVVVDWTWPPLTLGRGEKFRWFQIEISCNFPVFSNNSYALHHYCWGHSPYHKNTDLIIGQPLCNIYKQVRHCILFRKWNISSTVKREGGTGINNVAQT